MVYFIRTKNVRKGKIEQANAGTVSKMQRKNNVYQCIVNISSQDFGVYFKRKASVGVGSKAEQHGSGKDLLVVPEEDVMESQSNVGGVEWCQWALVIFMKACWWLVGVRSLLGWLWWRWIVLLAGMLKFDKGGNETYR